MHHIHVLSKVHVSGTKYNNRNVTLDDQNKKALRGLKARMYYRTVTRCDMFYSTENNMILSLQFKLSGSIYCTD